MIFYCYVIIHSNFKMDLFISHDGFKVLESSDPTASGKKKKKECKIHSALFAAVMSNGETPEQLREGTGVGLSAEESPSS